MAQTSYTKNPAIAVSGQIASTAFHHVIARAAEAILTPGRLVSRGTDPDTQVNVPAVAADVTDDPMGIVVQSFDSDTDTYEANTMVNVLRQGHIYVTCASAFTAGDPVLAADATGIIEGTAGAGISIVPGAVFLTSGGAADIAEIEIDLSGQ